MGRDFLKEIIERKAADVAKAKQTIPESLLRETALKQSQFPRRPFFDRLKNPGPSGINIIAEIKRASPSKGPIRPDLDAAKFAADYEAGGASAISVLTEQHYFKGSVEDLQLARLSSSLPVLRKDFLISSYQVFESAVIGADAVLLIVRILSPDQLREYLSLCGELGMDALVEINSEADLETATLAGANLIGINNRNLSSFETDIQTAIRLKSLLAPGQVPIAASGISCRKDIEENIRFGITNFLIGESVVRAGNTQEFLRSLLYPMERERK